jgi:hypothetical protein
LKDLDEEESSGIRSQPTLEVRGKPLSAGDLIKEMHEKKLQK